MYRCSRIVMGTLCVGGLLLTLLCAEEPAKKGEAAKPQWQRYLQGEDEKNAAELEKRLNCFLQTGQLAEALKMAESLAVFRQKVQGADHWQAVAAHWTVTALRCALKQGEETRKEYVTIDELARQAATLESKGRYREAQPLREKILTIYRKVLDERHPYIATSYNNLALNQNAQGKYEEAEGGFRKALAICRKVLGEQHPDMARGYNNLALNQHTQGKYQEAEEGYRKALAICRKVLGEENPQTASSYNNLAMSQHDQGKYAEAEEGCHKALAISRKVLGEEHPDTATSYNSLAYNQHAQGKYEEAEEGHRKALAIRRKVLGEEHPHTAASYNNLALNQNAQGKYEEAEEGYRKALAICLKVLGEEHPRTATSYNNVAANQDAQGKYEEAEGGFRKALAIRRKLLGEEHPHTDASYHNLACTQDRQGKYEEAEEGHRNALAINLKVLGEQHPRTAGCYDSLATNLNAQGKYAEAEDLWRRAAVSFAKARLHIATTGLGRAAKTSELSPLPSLAGVLARNGKSADAWQRFEESLARGTLDDLTTRFRWTSAEQANHSQILGRIERLDKLIESLATPKKPTPQERQRRDELLRQLRQAQDALAEFTRQLEQKYGPIAGQVLECKQIQAALPADTALIGWLDIAGHPKEADPNGEHWAVLLRSSGDPVWVRLRGSGDKGAWTADDTQLPAELRGALQSPRGDWRPLAERLRQQRLQPLAKHLKGVRRLIVLPSTALAGVPVEVIADGYTVSYAHSGSMYAHLRKQPPPSGKGLFVLADPIFEAPAAAEKPKPMPADLASFRGNESAWKRLPGTRAEAAMLQRLFGKDEPASVLLDSDASEQRLNELATNRELGKYRYLHLATHGEVDNTRPLRSAVILARDHLPDDRQRTELLLSGQPIADGRLTAEEVLRRWNLNCELVTLSACQTALGKYERGEGFVGFAQAFVLSGSRSVCLSLWEVDDTATALLMERFYQNLLGKREGLTAPLGKAAALTEAKDWLRQLPRAEAVKRVAGLRAHLPRGKRPELPPLEETPQEKPAETKTKEPRPPFAHPHYWAAFVLIGHAD